MELFPVFQANLFYIGHRNRHRAMYKLVSAHNTNRSLAFLHRPRLRALVKPKMPLITAKACSTLALTFLGRARHADNAGIYNGAAGNAQALLLQVLAHRLKHTLAQFMPLQQMVEVQNRYWQRFAVSSIPVRYEYVCIIADVWDLIRAALGDIHRPDLR